MAAVLQPALWHRLLDLPIDFFHKYTSGDLANRAGGLSIISDLHNLLLLALKRFVNLLDGGIGEVLDLI